VADPLELLADIQLGGVQVDEFPGEPEYLAFAQAQDQDQDEGGVERLACVPGRFEEPARVIDCPGVTLPALDCAAIRELDGVTGFLVMISSSKTGLD